MGLRTHRVSKNTEFNRYRFTDDRSLISNVGFIVAMEINLPAHITSRHSDWKSIKAGINDILAAGHNALQQELANGTKEETNVSDDGDDIPF